MQTGTCVWFDAERGFGFLRKDGDGQDIFCHFSAIECQGYKKLDKGDEVEFEVEIGPKGKPQATGVRVLRKAQVV
jgi:CspA family cold shock protein